MEWFSHSTPVDAFEDDSLSLEEAFVDDEKEEPNYGWRLQLEPKPKSQNPHNYRLETSNIHMMQLQPACRIALDDSTPATCSQFSVDGKWLAIGNKAGFVQIHDVEDGRLAFKLDFLRCGLKKRWPCTTLCVRPCQPGDSSYNVLLSCDLNGHIHYWHMTSGMHLGISKEPNNSIYAIDFHPTGVTFATGGSDCKVRIYDAITRKPLQILEEGNGCNTAGHSNRVFAVKWHPKDTHIVLSGGWDNTIQVWDVRVHHSVRSIFGPFICGDSLDINEIGDLILTGSWRTTRQLQEWDFGSGKLFKEISLPQTGIDKHCRVYSAKYGKGISQDLVAAGGSGSNQTYLLSNNTNKIVGRELSKGEKATQGVYFSSNGSLLAVTKSNLVDIFNMDTSSFEHNTSYVC